MQHDMFFMRMGVTGGMRTLRETNPIQHEGELKWVLMRYRGVKHFYDEKLSGLVVNGENVRIP